MTFELFDPTDSCNKLLPLNPIENRVTFYRIYLFEKKLDAHAYPGKAPSEVLNNPILRNAQRTLRLALPIPMLFPNLQRKYGEVLLNKGGEQPIKISLDGAYLPHMSNKAAAKAPVEVIVTKQQVKNGRIKVGDIEVFLPAPERLRFLSEGQLLYTPPLHNPKVQYLFILESDQKSSNKTNSPKLPRYEIGLFSSFEQVWDLQGYSRGALVNSITLAPQEDLTIEVFTWLKHKSEEERTTSSEVERNLEINSMSHVAAKVARDFSDTTDSSGDIGLGLPLEIEGIPIQVDANADVSNQVKVGVQSSIDQITESTIRSSEKYKLTQQVKVVETHETGREDRIIRRIRNANNSHTLTLNYFEVLENYQVTTVLKDTRHFCVLVNNPDLGNIDPAFVVAYEDQLQRALLSRNYMPGFEAAKKLLGQAWFDNAVLKTEIEQTNDQNSMATPPNPPQKPIITIANNINKALGKLMNADPLKSAGVLVDAYNPFDGKDVSDQDKAKAEDALGLYNFWFKFKIVYPGINSKAVDFTDVMSNKPTEQKTVEALQTLLAGLDDDWLASLKLLALNLVLVQLGCVLLIPFPLLAPVLPELALIENNAGVVSLISKAKQELKVYESSTGAQVPAPAKGSPAPVPPRKDAAPQLFSLQDLAMAHAEFDKLVLHIYKNKTYYMNQIWKHENANARYERLKHMGLHLYVENRLLGFIGNKAILPLRIEALEKPVQDELMRQIANFTPDGTDQINGIDYPPIDGRKIDISIPTPALYMESLLGRCEALEPLELRALTAQVLLSEERAKQMAIETQRRQAKLDKGKLDPD
jgi:hypothetical protein